MPPKRPMPSIQATPVARPFAQTAIHITFLFSALAIALVDKLMQHPASHSGEH